VAEDVRSWFEHLVAGETRAPNADWFAVVAKVEPKGRYDLDLMLSAPYAPLLANLAALRRSAIVPRRSPASGGGPAKGLGAGSGPFRIAEAMPNRQVRYVKHADYWERGLPYVDEIAVRVVPDEAERVALLLSGDVSSAILRPESAARLKSEKGIVVLTSPGPVQRLTTLNTRRKPFDDLRTRQVVALVVDRRLALERVLGGEGRLTGPIPTGHGGWSRGPDGLPYRRDVRKAKQLLAEAGYADGLEVTIKVSAADPTALPLATILADQVREVGIELKVQQLGPSALARALDAGDFDLSADSVEFQADPDGYLSPRYHSAGPLNTSGFKHERFDEIVDRARAVLDPGERKRLYDEATAVLLDEVPSIWWFAENNVEAIRANIKGYSQSFTGRRAFLKRAWLDR
jgi:peptide/nickel transport system substrate-binding protein